MQYNDLAKTGTNRGGALITGNVVERTSPCTVSFDWIYIDYNGYMVPCCDIRSDYEKHKNYIVYKLSLDNCVFSGYANSRLVQWRRDLARVGQKAPPCNSCSRNMIPLTPENIEFFRDVSLCAEQEEVTGSSSGLSVL